MAIPLSAVFFNQIYHPTIELLNTLASHPFAVEPQSNILLHQFEGITLHANHFSEKNNLFLTINSRFRDIANSIKHLRDNPSTQIELSSAIIYEIGKEGFRFVRNTILAKYLNNSQSEFDAIEELMAQVNAYLKPVALDKPSLTVKESSYSFYEWAIAYYKEDYAALTQSVRILTVSKLDNTYIKVDHNGLKFVIFGSELIGQDPKPHYPAVQ